MPGRAVSGGFMSGGKHRDYLAARRSVFMGHRAAGRSGNGVVQEDFSGSYWGG